MNSNNNGSDGENNTPPSPEDGRSGKDNIIRIPSIGERDRLAREKRAQEDSAAKQQARAKVFPAEPMINMPPVTKYALLLLIGVHLVITYLLTPLQAQSVMLNFGFVPAAVSAGNFTLPSLLSPITHMFLHGGWLHLMMNAFMLAAFGSGVEKWLGSKRLVILFIISGLFGVLAHYILNTQSPFPMIGASGAISGLFAAAIIMINRGQREMGGRWGILPFVLLWIGLSIGFGMIGGPDGSAIAWAAHVGGFLGGFAVLRAMRV